MKRTACLIATLTFAAGSALATTYDVVINNGRVMDPETKFDSVRNVGIYMLSKHLAITPDLQYIKDPALNPNESSIWTAGIRARLTI